jgi:restriction endonuclease
MDDNSNESPFPEGLSKNLIYELVVKKVVERLSPGARVQHNVRVPVVGDDRVRQVDVYIEGSIAGFPYTVVIDCKHYGKPLDVKNVDEFLGMLDDIKPNMGVLVSLHGFGSGAKKRAAKEGRRLNLCTVFLGGQPEFSAPIGVGVILVQRSDLEVRARMEGGAEFIGPISWDFYEWEVIDGEGVRWSVLELVERALNADPQLADADEGTYVVPKNTYKLVCTDGSAQAFEKLEIDFRSKLRFFRRSSRFDTGVAILNDEGEIMAHSGLGATMNLHSEEDPWEEISAEDARGGLLAEVE